MIWTKNLPASNCSADALLGTHIHILYVLLPPPQHIFCRICYYGSYIVQEEPKNLFIVTEHITHTLIAESLKISVLENKMLFLVITLHIFDIILMFIFRYLSKSQKFDPQNLSYQHGNTTLSFISENVLSVPKTRNNRRLSTSKSILLKNNKH